MELQQLRYVLAVARERNFTRAAASCFVVQSALSHQVKALETELGTELFRRTSRCVELTSAGEAFLHHAQACLDAAEQAVAQAAAAEGVVRGPLRVGAVSTLTSVDLAALLPTFRGAHPDVIITLRVSGSDRMQEDLTGGRLDVAFLGLSATSSPNTTHRELCRHRLDVVLPTAHPLAGRHQLTLADLVDEDFVDFPHGSTGRVQSDRVFEEAGLTRKVTMESADLSLLGELVARGLVIALLPPGVVTDWAGLVARPLLDGPERVEYVAWKGFNPTPAAKALLDLVAG
ncbi:LysR family transcriptional regulator [Luteococcus sediminum]